MAWLMLQRLLAFALHVGGGVRDCSYLHRQHQQALNNCSFHKGVAYFASGAFVGVAAHDVVESDIDWNGAVDNTVVVVGQLFERLRLHR